MCINISIVGGESMYINKSMLIEDKRCNLWKFYIKDNGDLIYNNCYGDNQWTKDTKIDKNVVDFSIKIDDKNNIYIVYFNKNRELKYYTWNGTIWSGKVLYSFDDMQYMLGELELTIIERKLHIFFIFKSIERRDSGILMHYMLDGYENASHTIANIKLIPSVNKHYSIEVVADSVIYLFYIGDEYGEAALRNSFYQDEAWNKPKKLYGLNGDKIEYCTLEMDNEFHLLNISRENLIYSLEHAHIDFDGKLNSHKIYESNLEVSRCMLFINENILWALWMEKDTICYASFESEWGEPKRIQSSLNNNLVVYEFLSSFKQREKIKAKSVLGTLPPDIMLFIPNSKGEGFTKEESMKDFLRLEEEESDVETLLDEVAKEKHINKGLQRKIASLQLQLLQKERKFEDLEDKYKNLQAQKMAVEEKNLKVLKMNEEKKA